MGWNVHSVHDPAMKGANPMTTILANQEPVALPACRAEGSNWLPLLVLLALVIPLRGWLMWNTEVLARDSVTYIEYALRFEQHSWKEVLESTHQHPGYPLSILAMSIPVRQLLGPADCFTMQLSAQLVSNLAAVLLIFPMYFLGRFFFERRIAFWGTLLFQFLPVSGQLLSDGVSEPLYLLLISSAFLCALWALRRQSLLLFAVCGIFCGLSYLTRPEAALVFASTLLVLGIGPLVRGWRQSWKANFCHGLVLTLASLAVGSLYFGTTHTFSNKPSLKFLMFGRPVKPVKDTSKLDQANAVGRPVLEQKETAASVPLFASIFGDSLERKDPFTARLGKGLLIFGMETLHIFHYVGFLAVLLGFIWHLQRLRAVPEFALPCVFSLLHSSLLLALACKVGYLSNRHLLPVALWGMYFAAAGFCDLSSRLRQWRPDGFAIVKGRLLARMSLLLLLAFVGLCLPRTMQKLHASQAGNHLAGLWLAEHFKKGDFIRDDHNWTSFYAGEMFHMAPEPPEGRKSHWFVVITRSRDPKSQEKLRRQEQDLRDVMGTVVFHWPQQVPEDQARVLIYTAVNDNVPHWWNGPPE